MRRLLKGIDDLYLSERAVIVFDRRVYEVMDRYKGYPFLRFYGKKVSLSEVGSLDEFTEVMAENEFDDAIKIVRKKVKLGKTGDVDLSNAVDYELASFLVAVSKKLLPNAKAVTFESAFTLENITDAYLKYNPFGKVVLGDFVVARRNVYNITTSLGLSLLNSSGSYEVHFRLRKGRIEKDASITPKQLEDMIRRTKETFPSYLINYFNGLVSPQGVPDNIIEGVNNGFAVLKESKAFYKKLFGYDIVYTHVSGPYILYERKNGKYYRFNGCDVGVVLERTSHGIDVKGTYPHILNDYRHPASPSTGLEGRYLKPVCCGSDDVITRTLADGSVDPVNKVITVLDNIEFTLKSGYYSQGDAWTPMYANEDYYKDLEVRPGSSGFRKELVTNYKG